MESKQEKLGRAIIDVKNKNPGMTTAVAADHVYNHFEVVTNTNGKVSAGSNSK